jgi:hypothetical protein
MKVISLANLSSFFEKLLNALANSLAQKVNKSDLGTYMTGTANVQISDSAVRLNFNTKNADGTTGTDFRDIYTATTSNAGVMTAAMVTALNNASGASGFTAPESGPLAGMTLTQAITYINNAFQGIQQIPSINVSEAS